MRAQFLSLISRIGDALSTKFIALLVGLVLLLVLYGRVSEERVFWLLLLFVCVRMAYLAREFLRKPRTAADWENIYRQLLAHYEALSKDALEQDPKSAGPDARSSPQDLASAALAAEQRKEAQKRSRGQIACEALGLLAFALVIPVAVALYTRDFVSLRSFQDWRGFIVVAASIGLYSLPYLWPGNKSSSRASTIWWGTPLLPALVLLGVGVASRHPYLNPFRPDHTQLAADRVLSLREAIVGGRHADWVIAYARLLDQNGESERSIHYYREGLRLNPNQSDVRTRLAELGASTGSSRSAVDSRTAWDIAHRPFWTDGQTFPRLMRCEVDAELERLPRMTAVIVPIGDVGDWLIDAVGYAIAGELDLPVCAASRPVPVPPESRVSGLLGGKQWSDAVLMQAFVKYASPLPRAPVRFVLLTPVDMYFGNSNYAFSASNPNLGGVISFARFGDPARDRSLLAHRTAKQSVSALMQSFGVPKSSDPNCVTSYSNSLSAFDAKGNRPNLESLAIFRQTIRSMDAQWAAFSNARNARGN